MALFGIINKVMTMYMHCTSIDCPVGMPYA